MTKNLIALPTPIYTLTIDRSACTPDTRYGRAVLARCCVQCGVKLTDREVTVRCSGCSTKHTDLSIKQLEARKLRDQRRYAKKRDAILKNDRERKKLRVIAGRCRLCPTRCDEDSSLCAAHVESERIRQSESKRRSYWRIRIVWMFMLCRLAAKIPAHRTTYTTTMMRLLAILSQQAQLDHDGRRHRALTNKFVDDDD